LRAIEDKKQKTGATAIYLRRWGSGFSLQREQFFAGAPIFGKHAD
jgi:hypothetical protein